MFLTALIFACRIKGADSTEALLDNFNEGLTWMKDSDGNITKMYRNKNFFIALRYDANRKNLYKPTTRIEFEANSYIMYYVNNMLAAPPQKNTEKAKNEFNRLAALLWDKKNN